MLIAKTFFYNVYKLFKVRKRGSRTLRRLYSVEEEGFSPQDVPPVHPSGYLEIREVECSVTIV